MSFAFRYFVVLVIVLIVETVDEVTQPLPVTLLDVNAQVVLLVLLQSYLNRVVHCVAFPDVYLEVHYYYEE